MLTIDHLEKCFGSTVLFRDLTFTVDGPAVLWAPSGAGTGQRKQPPAV